MSFLSDKFLEDGGQQPPRKWTRAEKKATLWLLACLVLVVIPVVIWGLS